MRRPHRKGVDRKGAAGQMNSKLIEKQSLFLDLRPNRSLSKSGRVLWLGLLGAAILVLSIGAATMGAWIALCFAAMELGLIVCAFRLIRRHDDDYEMLHISGSVFHWESRRGGMASSLEGNLEWAQLSSQVVDGRFELSLNYAGRMVRIANLLPDEKRRALGRELVGLLGGAR